MTAKTADHPVKTYINAYQALLSAFNCPQPYMVKPMTDCAWRVTADEGMHFLSFNNQNAVIVRQDGRPMIYRADGYVLVIAIDCVKIAFLLSEKQELTS